MIEYRVRKEKKGRKDKCHLTEFCQKVCQRWDEKGGMGWDGMVVVVVERSSVLQVLLSLRR
jgi:hypothetical protein